METQKQIEGEFQKLKQEVNELQKVFDLNVAIGYNEKEIEICDGELEIKLENIGEYYDYWTWAIKTSSIQIFISTTNQSLLLFSKAKAYRVNAEISINYNYVEQDLLICNDAECAFEEIVEIIQVFRKKGEQGIFEKFLDDYQISALI